MELIEKNTQPTNQQTENQQVEKTEANQTIEFTKIQKSVEELSELRDQLLQKQKAEKEAKEQAEKAELEKEGNELKKIMVELAELKKELSEVKNIKTELETKDKLNKKFNSLTKDFKIDKNTLKDAIGFDEIQNDEILTKRLENLKNIFMQNGQPLAVGTPDPEKKAKHYDEILTKIINS